MNKKSKNDVQQSSTITVTGGLTGDTYYYTIPNDSQQTFTSGYASASTIDYTSLDVVDVGGLKDYITEAMSEDESLKEEIMKKTLESIELDEDCKLVARIIRGYLEKIIDTPDNILGQLIQENQSMSKRIETLERQIQEIRNEYNIAENR